MNLNDYSVQALSTLTSDHDYGDVTAELMAQVLGLVGESGEVAEKFKKLIRDKNGVISIEDKNEIIKELGDILWYINAVSHMVGSDINQVAEKNLQKVLSRKERGATKGSGDNR